MGLCKKILYNQKLKDLSAKKLQKLDPIQLEGGPVGFWIKIHLNPNI
jgi:hypothetical protein